MKNFATAHEISVHKHGAQTSLESALFVVLLPPDTTGTMESDTIRKTI